MTEFVTCAALVAFLVIFAILVLFAQRIAQRGNVR